MWENYLIMERIKLNISSMPFIEMPFTVFGDIEAVIELQKDKLIIEQLTSTGPDIKLNVSGDIILKSDKNPSPRLNLTATILPSEAWINDNNMNAIYKICEKHDDGSIKLKLNGTTKRLKHDCGTPIPEPEPEVDTTKTPDNPDDGDTKEDDKDKKDIKEDKKDKDIKEDKKEEKPPKEETTKDEKKNEIADSVRENGRFNKDRAAMGRSLSRDSGMREALEGRPTRPMHPNSSDGNIVKSRSNRMAPPPTDNPAINRLNDRLNNEIMREMEKNPRERERMNFDRRMREREEKELNNE